MLVSALMGLDVMKAAYAHAVEEGYRFYSYGDAGIAWCVHDTQYLLAWAVLDLDLKGHFAESVTWLARLLAARDFPLDRLARDLELAAEAVDEEYGAKAKKVVAVLRSGVPLVERSARSVEE
jgi:hypothetical protein